jgi:hypothetical protein
MVRIVIPMNKELSEALILYSVREHRDPKVQAALIIAKELQRRGLLSSDPKQQVKSAREA